MINVIGLRARKNCVKITGSAGYITLRKYIIYIYIYIFAIESDCLTMPDLYDRSNCQSISCIDTRQRMVNNRSRAFEEKKPAPFAARALR